MQKNNIFTKQNITRLGWLIGAIICTGGGITAYNSNKDDLNSRISVVESNLNQHKDYDDSDRAQAIIERRELNQKLDIIMARIEDLHVQTTRLETLQGIRVSQIKKNVQDTSDGTEVKTANYAYYNQKEK